MSYGQVVKKINLKDHDYYQQWQTLLNVAKIEAAPEMAIDGLTCLGVFQADQLVATGSFQANVLKYIAVAPDYHDGKLFNLIISNLINELAQQQIFHLFVFTKPRYQASFEFVGFKLLAKTDMAVLLETGVPNIADYLTQIPQSQNQATLRVSAIVMNANPFTKGHRYLVEQAAQASDLVYVFVVKQDVSLFKTAERLQLVQAGVADLANVKVVSGEDYMVSYATFPAYFIPNTADIVRYQTTMDATLFKQQIAQPLHITTRFLGAEPFSKTTALYNQALQQILPPEVQVKILPRLTTATKVISATQVRRAIQQNKIETIQDFVPQTTYRFIQKQQSVLQARIAKGMRIDGN